MMNLSSGVSAISWAITITASNCTTDNFWIQLCSVPLPDFREKCGDNFTLYLVCGFSQASTETWKAERTTALKGLSGQRELLLPREGSLNWFRLQALQFHNAWCVTFKRTSQKCFLHLCSTTVPVVRIHAPISEKIRRIKAWQLVRKDATSTLTNVLISFPHLNQMCYGLLHYARSPLVNVVLIVVLTS